MFLLDSVCDVEKGYKACCFWVISVDSSIKISYPNTVQILKARVVSFSLYYTVHNITVITADVLSR